jgi:curved DNA-binding protein CbpA
MTRQELSFLFHGARRENVKKLRAKDLIEVFDLLSDSVKNCFSAEQLRHPEVKRLYDQFLQKSNRFNYFDFDSSSGSNSTSNINWKDFLSYFNLGTSQPNSPSEENYQPRSHLFSSFIDPHQKHYEALGLSVGANEDEIKRAYRNLILLYHPDKQKKMPHETCDAYQKRCGVIEEKCKNINEAYGILTKKI